MTETAFEPIDEERPVSIGEAPRRRAGVWMSVLVLGVALALAPVTAASASQSTTSTTQHSTGSHKSKHKKHNKHNKAKAKAKPAASTSAKSVCSFLDDTAGSAAIANTIESAEKSGNFSAAQQTLLNLFGEIAKDAPTAEAELGSAPSNVQAAFKTMISFDSQFKTALASATSFAQLGSAFATLGSNPTLSAASTTVGDYATSLCGG